jgi:hypothetical protein
VYIASDSLYVVTTAPDTLNAGYLPSSGGDNWGSQVVQTDATLIGTGILANLLKVDTTVIATQYDLTQLSSTDTSGYNYYFNLTGQTLAVGDLNDTLSVTLPVVGISAGTGISTSSSSGVVTVTNTAPDQTVVLNAGTGISTSGTYPTFTITNTAPDQTVSITGAGISSVTGTYPSFTVTSTEVDGSVSNEGTLGVSAGTGTTAIITSNTSGATGVTVSAGTGIGVTESTSSNGGTITITNSAPDQTVSITGAGINVASGTYPNFTITGTEVDGSVSNEGTLGVGAGGANTSVITSNTSGATGVTISGGAGITITESTSSNGGTVTITAVDQSATNEIQTLSISGDQLTISGGNTVTLPAGGGGGGTPDTVEQVMTLIHNNQTPSSNHSSTTAESGALLTYNLPANDFDFVYIEFLAYSALDPDANLKVDFTYRLKEDGTTVATFDPRIIASSTTAIDGGGRSLTHCSHIRPAGSASTVAYTVTAQHSNTSTLAISTIRNIRAYGIKDVIFGSGGGGAIDTIIQSADTVFLVSGVDTSFFILPPAPGDDWGTQVVETDATLTGEGLISNLLKVDTTIIATQYYVTSQGYTTNTGTVTSVSGTGTVNGISLSGTVTTSGNLTLGGTLSGVSLTSQVTGTLPVGNGGTGATTLTGLLVGNGTSAVSAIAGTASQLLRRNASNTAYEFFSPTYLTGNETITLSGDVTGSGATSVSTTIASNVVSNAKLRQSAGRSVIGRSVNTTGNVADITAGSDNQFLVTRGGELGFGSLQASDIPDISATYYLASNPAGYTTNTGTVTSVGLSLPSMFSVSGSPVTGAGTLTATLANQNANLVFSGPASGGAAAPTFRSLVSDDIPALDMAKITTGNLAWSRISSTPTTLSGYGITDAVANTRNVNTSGSLTGGGNLSADRTLSLVNDNATPGNNKYYGTDGSGTIGFFDIPGGGGGEANTASNLGSGYGLFGSKSGVDLRFKSLVPGEGIKMDSTSTEITINTRKVITPHDTTATTYTLALIDMDRRILFTSGSNVTVTIPLNSSVPFPIGTVLTMYRYGAGELEVSATGGVTLNSAQSYKRANYQYQAIELYKVDTDEWVLIGDLKN